MNTYEIKVTTKTLIVKAKDENEAEAKYDAYWFEEECPCGAPTIGEGDCECIEVFDEPDHTTTLIEDWGN